MSILYAGAPAGWAGTACNNNLFALSQNELIIGGSIRMSSPFLNNSYKVGYPLNKEPDDLNPSKINVIR